MLSKTRPGVKGSRGEGRRMKERQLLRFDTIVAICALLISALTAGAMVYQTRVIEEQFSATVWPYLAVETTYNPTSIDMHLVNEGAGPALIRSARMSLDGRTVAGWGDVVRAVARDPKTAGSSATISSSSVDASVAIRPGETHGLLAVRSAKTRMIAALAKHRIALDFCYCSINEKCWRLHDDVGNGSQPAIPVPVGACAIGKTIAAQQRS